VAIIAVLYMGLMSVVFLFPASPNTTVNQMNFSVVVLSGVFIFSLVYYYFPKYGGKHWFKGPIANIDRTSHPKSDHDGGSIISQEGKEKKVPNSDIVPVVR
jgi:hypothetical protein